MNSNLDIDDQITEYSIQCTLLPNDMHLLLQDIPNTTGLLYEAYRHLEDQLFKPVTQGIWNFTCDMPFFGIIQCK